MPEVSEETRFKEAHLWHVRLSSDHATDQDWIAFAAWLEEDDGNSDVYHRVADLADFVADHRDACNDEWRTGEETVSNVAGVANLRPSNARPRSGRKYLAGFVAVAATFLFVMAGIPYFFSEPPSAQEYSAGYASPRLVTLQDGSKIHLNVNSKIEVFFDDKERRINLSYGEVLFDVVKDPGRPFSVEAGDSRIQVLGTAFNVLRHNGEMIVTVSHGVVDVSANVSEPSTRPFTRQRLTAGEQLRHREGSLQADVLNIDINAALAWREGRLVYDEATLQEVADDLNRYFPTPIKLDERVLAYSFSGTLKTDDLNTILLLLEDSVPVKVTRTGARIVISPQ